MNVRENSSLGEVINDVSLDLLEWLKDLLKKTFGELKIKKNDKEIEQMANNINRFCKKELRKFGKSDDEMSKKNILKNFNVKGLINDISKGNYSNKDEVLESIKKGIAGYFIEGVKESIKEPSIENAIFYIDTGMKIMQKVTGEWNKAKRYIYRNKEFENILKTEIMECFRDKSQISKFNDLEHLIFDSDNQNIFKDKDVKKVWREAIKNAMDECDVDRVKVLTKTELFDYVKNYNFDDVDMVFYDKFRTGVIKAMEEGDLEKLKFLCKIGKDDKYCVEVFNDKLCDYIEVCEENVLKGNNIIEDIKEGELWDIIDLQEIGKRCEYNIEKGYIELEKKLFMFLKSVQGYANNIHTTELDSVLKKSQNNFNYVKELENRLNKKYEDLHKNRAFSKYEVMHSLRSGDINKIKLIEAVLAKSGDDIFKDDYVREVWQEEIKNAMNKGDLNKSRVLGKMGENNEKCVEFFSNEFVDCIKDGKKIVNDAYDDIGKHDWDILDNLDLEIISKRCKDYIKNGQLDVAEKLYNFVNKVSWFKPLFEGREKLKNEIEYAKKNNDTNIIEQNRRKSLEKIDDKTRLLSMDNKLQEVKPQKSEGRVRKKEKINLRS